MMYSIRPYQIEDYELLKGWWEQINEVPPTPGLLPIGSTFILEYNNQPVLSICLFLTNVEVCYLENFIADPEFKEPVRKLLSQKIVDYAVEHAKVRGYKRVGAFTNKIKLASRYKQLGLEDHASDVLILAKRII